MSAIRFRDRQHAGRVLAGLLPGYANRADVLVLALPRGGVPVGRVVADALAAPLDVLVVRKLGLPGREELAMGAIAGGGGALENLALENAVLENAVLNEDVLRAGRVDEETVRAVAEREFAELRRRERAYRGDRPPPELAGKAVIVVDDGAATGATMKVALLVARRAGPDRLVAAVPVAPPEVRAELGLLADEVVCASTPADFSAVGAWYDDFGQTGDGEVRAALA